MCQSKSLTVHWKVLQDSKKTTSSRKPLSCTESISITISIIYQYSCFALPVIFLREVRMGAYSRLGPFLNKYGTWTLYKLDTSLRRTVGAGPNGVCLRESWLYIYPQAPCDHNPCRNGGTCYPVTGEYDFKCACTPLFRGKRCHSRAHSRKYFSLKFWLKIVETFAQVSI